MVRRILPVLLLLCAVGTLLTQTALTAAQVQKRQVTVDAKRYAFTPAKIEVFQGDVVEITLVPADIPHSFTIDAYKIAKRAEPGKPVTFEFLCDKPGSFRFFCNLTADEGCRRMAGQLVVRAK